MGSKYLGSCFTFTIKTITKHREMRSFFSVFEFVYFITALVFSTCQNQRIWLETKVVIVCAVSFRAYGVWYCHTRMCNIFEIFQRPEAVKLVKDPSNSFLHYYSLLDFIIIIIKIYLCFKTVICEQRENKSS